MKRLVSVVAAVAVLAALVATSAFAKGASEAMITAPVSATGSGGRRRPCRRRRADADRRGRRLLPAVFATNRTRCGRSAPRVSSGPATRSVHDAGAERASPTARAGSSIPMRSRARSRYVAPGQRYFGRRAVGGWFVASTALTDSWWRSAYRKAHLPQVVRRSLGRRSRSPEPAAARCGSRSHPRRSGGGGPAGGTRRPDRPRQHPRYTPAGVPGPADRLGRWHAPRQPRRPVPASSGCTTAPSTTATRIDEILDAALICHLGFERDGSRT